MAESTTSLIQIHLAKPHINQEFILKNKKRFNIVKTGRRFGKTEIVKLLSSYALQGKFIGIWFPTYKDLSDVWRDLIMTFHPAIISKNEQLKEIHLINGGKIDFWSMDDPDAGRGRKYHRTLADEVAKARKFKDCWQGTIRPTLTDYKGDAWFFSTPKGKSNYFYTLEQKAKEDNLWAYFKFTSYDNPYLDASEIDIARGQLDDLTFRQEYLAEDVDANDKPFLYAFNQASHVVKENYEPNPHLNILISFDFNKDPMTCSIGQGLNIRTLRVFDCLKIPNGSTPELCDMIIAKYPQFMYKMDVTGDSTGHNRSPLLQGDINHYVIIRQKLKLKDYNLKVQSKNRELSASRILCNSILQNADVTITSNCNDVINDLTYAAVDSNGDLIKSQSQGLHFFDGFRYMLEAYFPNFIDKPHLYKKKV